METYLVVIIIIIFLSLLWLKTYQKRTWVVSCISWQLVHLFATFLLLCSFICYFSAILSFVKAYFFFSFYILKATLAQRKDNDRLTKHLNNGNFLGALLDLLRQFNISWNHFLVQSLTRLKIYNKTTRVARLWAVLVGNLAILFFVAFPLCYLFYMVFRVQDWYIWLLMVTISNG